MAGWVAVHRLPDHDGSFFVSVAPAGENDGLDLLHIFGLLAEECAHAVEFSKTAAPLGRGTPSVSAPRSDLGADRAV